MEALRSWNPDKALKRMSVLSKITTTLHPQRMSPIHPLCRNVHGAASVTIGPYRTLVAFAANGGFEPTLTDATVNTVRQQE